MQKININIGKYNKSHFFTNGFFIMSFVEQNKTTCYAGGIEEAEALMKKIKSFL